jgi:hypothetical protein
MEFIKLGSKYIGLNRDWVIELVSLNSATIDISGVRQVVVGECP